MGQQGEKPCEEALQFRTDPSLSSRSRSPGLLLLPAPKACVLSDLFALRTKLRAKTGEK